MSILANRAFAGLFVAFTLCSCSSSSSKPGLARDEIGPLVVAPEPGPPADAAVGISEVQARRELDLLFRDAGLRILNDEPLHGSAIEVVLDGYDPERHIGYEYIDASEAAQSLGTEARVKLGRDHRLLFLDACSLDELRRAASSFLERATSPDAGPN